MQGFVWVVFFKKATKAFSYPALLTVDGSFHFFSSQALGKSEVISIQLTEARICLYTVFIRISAQPRMSAHHHSLPLPMKLK